MKRLFTLLLIPLLLLLPVGSIRAQEPTLPPAIATQQAEDNTAVRSTLDALTPEPTATSEPTNEAPVVNVDVKVENPPPADPTPEPVDNSETYLFALAVVAVIVIAAMGYLMERKDPKAAAKLYEDALRRAYETKQTPYDEVGLEAWLTLRGFKVVRNPDGTLNHVEPPAQDTELKQELEALKRQVEENRVVAGAQLVTPTDAIP